MFHLKPKRKSVKYFLPFFVIILVLMPHYVHAQQTEEDAKAAAQQFLRDSAFNKALPVLQQLYKEAPFDKQLYNEYLEALIQTKNFTQADSVVRYMMQIRRGDPALLVDLGSIATASGHKRKAKQFYEQAIDQLANDEFQIRALAQSFSNAGLPEYAIQTYLKARANDRNPYEFATELSLLYNQTGDYKGAIQALLDKAMTQVDIMDDLKDGLTQIILKEKDGLKNIRQSLNNRLKENPNNPIWQQLLSWTYAQSGDYEGALKNLIRLDETFKEQGRRLLPFAKSATEAGQFTIAAKAYDYVMKTGIGAPYYQPAYAGKLDNGLKLLKTHFPPAQEEVTHLLAEFKDFFTTFPQYKNDEQWRQYAMVEARYNNRPDSAIVLLKEVAGDGTAMSNFQGECRLDMGDDYLLEGKIWDATLLYSQVNKAFEQDELGEQARFKNAKWAFYKGDFQLAQQQLSVLKASTSRLIANDALYLSVLITENTPQDSNMVPLQRFAAADLLLFKHQTKAADSLLDSISKAWPQSPLQDDIAMLRGKTAEEAGQWQQAIHFYQIVLTQYGDDVLGDDAAWQLAELYRKQLKDTTQAENYYKTLILKYPGSTFVQEARKWYQQLSNNAKAPPGNAS